MTSLNVNVKKIDSLIDEIQYLKNVSIPHLKEIRLNAQKNRENLEHLLEKRKLE